MPSASKASRELAIMGGTLAMIGAIAVLAGALGALNALHGDFGRASTTLGVPLFLAYWAYSSQRDQGAIDPLIPVWAGSWLLGLPVGLAAYVLQQLLVG